MRLTLESSLNIKSLDTVFDICGRQLKVKDYSITYDNGKPIDAKFGCYSLSGDFGIYKYSQLYDSFEDLDDAEKSFLKYLQKNPDIVYFDLEEIDSLRGCYIDAFYSGYNHKLKYTAEEQLQK